MLKKICRLFLGLVVCAGSACVTPTHASSAQLPTQAGLSPVIITHIQAGSSKSALSEYVALFNNSPQPANVSNWCLLNKSSIRFACLEPTVYGQQLSLPAYSTALITTPEYQNEATLSNNQISAFITLQNRSSGSIVASSDTLSLIDENDEIVDSFSWNSSAGTGKLWQRLVNMQITPGEGGDLVEATVADWKSVSGGAAAPANQIVLVPQPGQAEPGVEPGDGSGESPPVDTTEPEVEEPEGGSTNTQPPAPAANLPLVITEIFPNPEGSDTGNEFIEIYNPNSSAVSFESYGLQIGSNFEDTYSLIIASQSIQAGEYLSISSSTLKFTLRNTQSNVRLTFERLPVGDTVSYESPKSGYVWALVGDEWAYIDSPTPGAANPSNLAPGDNLLQSTVDDDSDTAVLKPCAPNQYRNPETNRCKLLASTATSEGPVACKVNQYRNPVTNRCNNIVAAAQLAPCKEGQRRNPETNRCVNIKQMSTSQHGLGAARTETASAKAVGWYMWAAIAGVVLAVLSYAVWEWRTELRQVLAGPTALIKAKFKRLNKNTGSE